MLKFKWQTKQNFFIPARCHDPTPPHWGHDPKAEEQWSSSGVSKPWPAVWIQGLENPSALQVALAVLLKHHYVSYLIWWKGLSGPTRLRLLPAAQPPGKAGDRHDCSKRSFHQFKLENGVALQQSAYSSITMKLPIKVLSLDRKLTS